jgi:hypothetical protein
MIYLYTMVDTVLIFLMLIIFGITIKLPLLEVTLQWPMPVKFTFTLQVHVNMHQRQEPWLMI